MSRLMLLALVACDQHPSKLDALATRGGPTSTATRTHDVLRFGIKPAVELHYQLADRRYTSESGRRRPRGDSPSTACPRPRSPRR